jgi:hypothetical protein
MEVNAASLLTTLVAIVAGFWIHREYLKGQPLWIVVGGTIAFGEAFKIVTGIETFPLQIFKKTRVGSQFDETLSAQIAQQSVS